VSRVSGKRQLDVAAVDDQDAVKVERFQSLTPAHRLALRTLRKDFA